MPKKKSWPPGIRPSGSGLLIRIWKGGRLVYHETLPCQDPTARSSITAAVKRREWLISRLNLGLSVGSEGEGRQTFSEAAQEYLDTLEARDSTVIEYYRIIKNQWEPALGKYPIDEISGAKVKKVLSGMGVSTKTKKNRLIPLWGVFKHAEIEPPRIRFKRSEKKRVQRYTPAERDKVLSKLDGQAKVYFQLLFATGLRPGEALGLEWSDYDGEYLSVTKSISKRRLGPTKTGASRRVYVPRWARGALNEHPSRFAGGYIFPNSIGTASLDTDNFNSEWKRAHSKARVPYRIPYTCRHTRAAELLSQGADIAKAARQLGHSVQVFLTTYSEFIEEYAEQDMSAFESHTAKKGTL